MKRLPGILAALLLIMSAFGACKLIVGPDTPGGNGGGGGTLTISFGDGGSGGSRAVTSGAELPGEVLAGMRYELNLTGPNHETIGRTVSAGETLRETVKAGQWRIDAAGYYHDVLAGTGSVTVTVVPGDNAVRIPMMMSGPCYEVTVDPRIAHGTVRANFGMAFEGTPVTLTVTPDSDSALKTGGLTYNGSVITGGPPYTFTLSGLDVTVGAEFVQFARYVRAGGGGDGTSWDNASGDLQGMMDELEAIPSSDYTGPRIVKVAAGTYRPQHKPDAGGVSIPAAGDRDSAFILRQGVQVWGGYPASGGDDAGRNIAANETILSGDLAGNDSFSAGAIANNSENAYHVVVGKGIAAGSGTVLDGLTIKGGLATGSGSNMIGINRNKGGGMSNYNSSPLLANVTISGNSASDGGGMYNSGGSAPALVNVTISGNFAAADGGGASSFGGGMYNDNSSPVLVNVLISGNSVTAGGGGVSSFGGGMYNDNSSPALVNVLISGNIAAASDGSGSSFIHGGGMYNKNGSSPALANVTVSGNIVAGGAGGCSLKGGGIYNDNSSPHINNSIIWGNVADSNPGIWNNSPTPVIAYSIVQGSGGSGFWITSTGTDGGNNKDTDPLFVSPDPASSGSPKTGGNYRLQSGSPATGAGDGGLYPANAGHSIFLAAGLSDTAKAAVNGALAKDLAGANRKNGTIDMGAYEKN